METKDIVPLGTIECGSRLVQDSFEKLKSSGDEKNARLIAEEMARKLTTPAIERAIDGKVDSLEILRAIHRGTEAGKQKKDKGN